MDEDHSVAHFIKYNNAVPIALGLIFLSTTATFAASPEVRDAVYSSETAIRSVDNSYIVSVDLDRYSFKMRVTSVTEDDEYYYVAYDFDTIDVIDGTWSDVTLNRELRVSKALLGDGELEAYVESELAQVRDFELARLLETQQHEKRIGVTPKTVATVYSGLVGRLVRPDEETAPFYQPPAAIQDPDNPLAIKDPKPVPAVVWETEEPEEPSSPTENEGDPLLPPPDVCPDMPSLQIDPDDCAPSPTEEPPAEEPVTEEPPVEEPPTEEPAPEPAPEPEPVPETPEEPTEEPETGGVE